jgi:hypothetical protein
MVWLIMSVISVVFTVFATTMTQGTGTDWYRIARIAFDFMPGMQVDMPVPGMNALIVGFVSVLLLGIGLVITYIDSRTAVEELRKRNSVYQVLLKRIHPLLWRDVLQSRQHSFVGALPIRFAQITFAFYLVKTLAGLLVLVFGFVIEGVGMFFPALTATLPVSLSTIFELVTNLFGWGVDEQGMLLCIYTGLILIAALFSRYERAFYDDYAVMQQQLLRRQN